MDGKIPGKKRRHSRRHSSRVSVSSEALSRTEAMWMHLLCNLQYRAHVLHTALWWWCFANVQLCESHFFSCSSSSMIRKRIMRRNRFRRDWRWCTIYATVNLLVKLNLQKIVVVCSAIASASFVYTSNNRRSLMKFYVYGDWSKVKCFSAQMLILILNNVDRLWICWNRDWGLGGREYGLVDLLLRVAERLLRGSRWIEGERMEEKIDESLKIWKLIMWGSSWWRRKDDCRSWIWMNIQTKYF
jgi:hypothetical protein